MSEELNNTNTIEPTGGTPGVTGTADLAAIREMLEQHARQLSQLSQTRQAPPPNTPPPANPPVQPGSGVVRPGMTKEQIEQEFWKNPLEVSATIARMAAAEATNGMFSGVSNTLYEAAKSKARESNPELFDRYLPEIEATVAQAPENYRSNVLVWHNAMRMVFGAHIEDIAAEKNKTRPSVEAPAVHIRNDGPAVPSPRTPPGPRKEELSAEEKYIARNLGLSEDSYRLGKELLSQQDPVGPSRWDEVITTDSSARRRSNASK
jgi:hypothetical protein